MRVLTLFAAILVMTCASYAQNGNGNTNGNGATQLFDIPISGATYNSCCDEMVYLDGTAHVVVRKDGSYHLTVKDVTGTTASQNVYTQRGVSTQNDNTINNPGTATFTIQFENEDGCGFAVTRIYHVTYPNDSATPSVTLDKEMVRCLD